MSVLDRNISGNKSQDELKLYQISGIAIFTSIALDVRHCHIYLLLIIFAGDTPPKMRKLNGPFQPISMPRKI